jgi:glycosyltransferase involved in cell wall biosynthesis
MATKVLFVTRIVRGRNHIFEKVIAQCKGIRAIGYDVDLLFVGEAYDVYLNDVIIARLGSRNGIQLLFFERILRTLDLAKYQFVFIRHPFVVNQLSYLRFLRAAWRSKCKVVVEIPTFPYRRELKGLPSKLIYFAECLCNNRLKRYVSFVLYSGDKRDTIHGIRCRQLLNVGDIDRTPISRASFCGRTLRLVAVSGCMTYNAYERVIEGLHRYYMTERQVIVEFHLGGTGPDHAKYVALVKKYSLAKHVFFYGPVFGEEKDRLFEAMHVGISCLGMHRIGLSGGSPLKTADYGSRGIPFVLSYDDPMFSGQAFCLNVPPTEEGIDVGALVEWYVRNDFDADVIRKFTVDKVSWKKQYNDIFAELAD